MTIVLAAPASSGTIIFPFHRILIHLVQIRVVICVTYPILLRIKSCQKHSKSGEQPRYRYLELFSFYPLYHPILRLLEVRSSLTKFNKICMKYFLLILCTALIASTSIFLGCSNSSNSYRNESFTSYSKKSSRMNSNYKKKSYSRSYY